MNEKNQDEINKEIHEALFGNPDTGDVGVVIMTKQMYEAWSAIIWLGKIITWIAIVLAGVGTAWTLVVAGLKHFFTTNQK
jgi:hypothetical protein